jgi:hypothetical protein
MTIVAKIIPVILLIISATAAAQEGAREGVEIRRYLLSAGANDGGKDRVLLRYAVTDAGAFAAVLTDMGGVDKSNAFVLANPNSKEFLGGVANIGTLVAKDKELNLRSEVFIYYSGHADVDGLKLGGETLGWQEFRSAVNGLGADIRVAVVDACGSGAITRTKGGVARPAFLSDVSTNMKGYAFLASSNENEASQESDRIKGSYFTHALLSGMRGAADLTGDGKVTINEAYLFAFNETLRSTQNTSAGTQHPSRDMNMAGTGDIVMTDLRQTNAILSLSPEIEGRFFIRDANGNLFAELHKLRGRPIDLGMPPGKYSVQMEAPSRRWVANDIVISEGGKKVLSMSDMRVMDRRKTTARGDGGDAGEDVDVGEDINQYNERDTSGGDGGEEVSLDIDEDIDDPEAQTQDLAPSIIPPAPTTMQQVVAAIERQAAKLDSLMSIKTEPSAKARAEEASSQNIIPPTAPTEQARESLYSLNIGILSLAVGTGSEMTAYPMARGRGQMQGGVINLAEEIESVQGGIINYAQTVGFQGGNINIAGDAKFFQGGAINIAKDAGYFQGGALNLAGNVEYFQGGAMNLAGNAGYFQGGAMNLAGNAGYFQGGALNLAGRAGYQAGSLNVAGRVKRQIGAVNISGYSERTPIGLLNIVGNGIFDATVYADAAGDQGMFLRTGTSWLYAVIEYNSAADREYAPRDTSEYYIWPASIGYGFGTRLGMDGPFSVNLDFVWHNIYGFERDGRYGDDDWDWDDYWDDWRGSWRHWHGKARFGASYSPLPYLAVTGGLSLSGIVKKEGEAVKYKPNGSLYYDRSYRDYRARFWPGVYIGLTAGKVAGGPKKE